MGQNKKKKSTNIQASVFTFTLQLNTMFCWTCTIFSLFLFLHLHCSSTQMFCWTCTIFSALLASMSLQCSCSASQHRKWSSSLRWQKTHSGFNNSSLAVIFHLGDRIKHHVNRLGISRSQHILHTVSSQCKPVSPQVFFLFLHELTSPHTNISQCNPTSSGKGKHFSDYTQLQTNISQCKPTSFDKTSISMATPDCTQTHLV